MSVVSNIAGAQSYYGAPYQLIDTQHATDSFSTVADAVGDWQSRFPPDPRQGSYSNVSSWASTVYGGGYPNAQSAANAAVTNGCLGCHTGAWSWEWYSARGIYAYRIGRINPDGTPRSGVWDFWVYAFYSGTPFGSSEPSCSPSSISHQDASVSGGIAASVTGTCGNHNVVASAYLFSPWKNLANCPGNMCGNPINSAIGNKFQVETDFSDAGLLAFERSYNSHASAPTHLLGNHWTNYYARRIENFPGTSAIAMVARPDGRSVRFQLAGGVWTADADVVGRLSRLEDATGQLLGWTFTESDGRETENYDSLGRLSSISRTDGTSVTLTYNNGLTENNANDYLPMLVVAQDGRRIRLAYDPSRRLSQLTDPTGGMTTYAYDASGRLQSVTDPGGAGKTYLYNESAHTAGANLPTALTGIVDENGLRFATFAYAADGRAVSTEHAGGVEKFSMVYNADGTTAVTTPAGTVQQRGFVTPLGVKRTASVAITGAGITRTTSYTYDTNGRTDLVTDPLGTTTDHDFDARGLPTQVIESANQALTKRTTQTDWHATFNVPIERRTLNEANVLVGKQNWTYNARGQVVTVSVVDVTVTPNTSRTSTHTYCEAAGVTAGTCPRVGLLLSRDGPRTDVADTETYSYFQETDPQDGGGCAAAAVPWCEYYKGDLRTVTNALGQVIVELFQYDGAGRVLYWRDANNVHHRNQYSPRGWLLAVYDYGSNSLLFNDDIVTLFEYDLVGNVKKITQPDGAYLSFTYDDARRLTKVADVAGNSINYTPDNSGNILAESSKDPNGVVKRSLSRVFDTLGQLQTLADAQSTPTDFAYDLNGNGDLVTDPLGRIADSDVDALNRLRKVTANKNGPANEKAITQFGYDARDNLTSVIDPKGLTTSYVYSGFDDLKQMVSPDTGTTNFVYDSAGNRISQTDARGKTTGYTYDALGRLLSQTVPTAAQNVTFQYDISPGANPHCASEAFIGNLGKITDESGSTWPCFDLRGNEMRKTQIVTGGSTLVVQPVYNAAKRLLALTYPSGAIVTYHRDVNGNVEDVDAVPVPGGAQIDLVKNIKYLPFGPMTEFAFGNDRVVQKTYDQNYGIDAITDSSGTGLSQDFHLDTVGNVDTLTERLSAASTVTRDFAYDGLNRLKTQKNGSATVEGFAYDATGNRTSKTISGGTTAYSYGAGNHRLASVGSAARTYDNNGNTTLLGPSNNASTFTYDDRNRLREVRVKNKLKASYRYNGLGQRVLKTDAVTPANSRQYVYDSAGHLLGEYTLAGAAVKEYVWLDDTLVAILGNFDGSTYQYVETDHLGTPRAVVHPTENTILWRWDITPTAFGEHLPNGNPDGDAFSYTLNLRYPGQYFDAESGLHYNYFRDYEPATGRYIESDPIGLAGGTSTYGYVGGSPLSAIDPFGRNATTLTWGIRLLPLAPLALPAMAGGFVGGVFLATLTYSPNLGADPCEMNGGGPCGTHGQFASNVIPFPTKTKPKEVCPPSGDGGSWCEHAQKQLLSRHLFLSGMLATERMGPFQYNEVARVYNAQAALHNRECPSYPVALLPTIGPKGI